MVPIILIIITLDFRHAFGAALLEVVDLLGFCLLVLTQCAFLAVGGMLYYHINTGL